MSGGSQHNPNGRQSQLGASWNHIGLQMSGFLGRAPQAHMSSERATWHTPHIFPHNPPDPLQALKVANAAAANSVFRHTPTPPDIYRHTPTPPEKMYRHTPPPSEVKAPPLFASPDLFTLHQARAAAVAAAALDPLRDDSSYGRSGVDLSVSRSVGLSVRDAPTINNLVRAARVDALLERLQPAHSVIVHPRTSTTPPDISDDSADSSGTPKRKRKPDRTVRLPAPTNAPSPPPTLEPDIHSMKPLSLNFLAENMSAPVIKPVNNVPMNLHHDVIKEDFIHKMPEKLTKNLDNHSEMSEPLALKLTPVNNCTNKEPNLSVKSMLSPSVITKSKESATLSSEPSRNFVSGDRVAENLDRQPENIIKISSTQLQTVEHFEKPSSQKPQSPERTFIKSCVSEKPVPPKVDKLPMSVDKVPPKIDNDLPSVDKIVPNVEKKLSCSDNVFVVPNADKFVPNNDKFVIPPSVDKLNTLNNSNKSINKAKVDKITTVEKVSSTVEKDFSTVGKVSSSVEKGPSCDENKFVLPKSNKPIDDSMPSTSTAPYPTCKVTEQSSEFKIPKVLSLEKSEEVADSTSKKPQEAFVEVENELEKMFAGIEEVKTQVKIVQDDQKPETSKAAMEELRQSLSKNMCALSTSAGQSDTRRNKKKATPGKNKRKKTQGKKSAIPAKKSKVGDSKDVCDSVSSVTTSKTRGPYIQIRGSRDSPLSVLVVNAAADEDEDGASRRTQRRKTSTDGLHTRGLHRSTLGARYDASTRDPTWVCIFCNLGPHAPQGECTLGDLFGPYLASIDCDEYRELDESTRPTTENGTVEVWMHEDCALWTSGLVSAGARLSGLPESTWGARGSRCTFCNQFGATICCAVRGCNRRSHFPCALTSRWSLDEELLRAHCTQHKPH